MMAEVLNDSRPRIGCTVAATDFVAGRRDEGQAEARLFRIKCNIYSRPCRGRDILSINSNHQFQHLDYCWVTGVLCRNYRS